MRSQDDASSKTPPKRTSAIKKGTMPESSVWKGAHVASTAQTAVKIATLILAKRSAAMETSPTKSNVSTSGAARKRTAKPTLKQPLPSACLPAPESLVHKSAKISATRST